MHDQSCKSKFYKKWNHFFKRQKATCHIFCGILILNPPVLVCFLPPESTHAASIQPSVVSVVSLCPLIHADSPSASVCAPIFLTNPGSFLLTRCCSWVEVLVWMYDWHGRFWFSICKEKGFWFVKRNRKGQAKEERGLLRFFLGVGEMTEGRSDLFLTGQTRP